MPPDFDGLAPTELRREAERQLGYAQRSSYSPEETLEFAARLMGNGDIGLARSLLKRKVDTAPKGLRDRFHERLALATYKDPELRDVDALNYALDFVTGGETEPPEAGEPDAYGIPAAILKRLHAVTGDRAYLERSLRFYETGWLNLKGRDPGAHYPGVNAAFVHEMLADEVGRNQEEARHHLVQAERIRRDVIEVIRDGPADEWATCSMVEAQVGTGQASAALETLEAAADPLARKSWEGETFVRQLAKVVLARLQTDPDDDEALAVFGTITDLPADSPADRVRLTTHAAGLANRFGVALSGGGFRASFFHLGVLAAFAELDLLRRVEVMSCVSGGSIVGAHFALHLRQLIEEKGDRDITQGDYQAIVEQCIDSFVDGVTTRNLRLRALSPAGWWHRLRRGNNLSTRLAGLYDRHLFSGADPSGPSDRPVQSLTFSPAGSDREAAFNPKRDNWSRSARVPIVILNATSLNTGYGWQFAATWMGEPPIPADDRIDSLAYSERIYYEYLKATDVPSLGVAVAASACVPGLFPPIALDGLVEQRTVRLVDGGVYDNQGTAALLHHDCTAIFVSDASGQIAHSDRPSRTRFRSLLRSSSLSRAALRSRGFGELAALEAPRLPVWYAHLTSGLAPGRRSFTAGPDYDYYTPGEGDHEGWAEHPTALTDYGIPREMQHALAEIRTDLDRFSSTEADALMYSGYSQTLRALESNQSSVFPVAPRQKSDTWRFCSMADVMAAPGDAYDKALSTLKKGRHRFFRRLRRA